jgi:hypothetical protein
MRRDKKIKMLLAACGIGIAVWMLPALFGGDDDHRPDRRGAGHLPADVWRVEEGADGRVAWSGTWTRRGRSDVFDAVWRDVDNGGEARDRLRVIEATDRIVIHRDGNNGEYRGQLSRDGAHMEGTATWYAPGGFWRADAVPSR